MDRRRVFNGIFFFGALLVLMLFQPWAGRNDVTPLTYTDAVQAAKDGKVANVTITESLIDGEFKEPVEGKRFFLARRVDPAAAEIFERAGVKVSGGSDSNWLASLLSWVAPALVLFAVWALVSRYISSNQGLGGLVNIGKSKARVNLEQTTGVTFADVAGVDEAKLELQELVAFLQDKATYGRLGARVPKGILLVGPPGTGKTLLARAVAGEAAVPFFSISGSEFVEMFVGVGAARVRDLFEQARQAAPCIIFIDELDALGRARSSYAGYGGGDEKEQTLNQLLAELDGFDPRMGIVLLAATNRAEVLDPALPRAGRFDRQVVIDRPDRSGRIAILKVYLPKIVLDTGVDAEGIAAATPGFTSADLANLVNEAAIVATRRGAAAVSDDDFTSAMERVIAGSERKSKLLAPGERRRVAFHEMGHALVAAKLTTTDPVQKVSIIPRSIGALGYTMQRPTEDRFLMTMTELRERITALMAGRAAEEIIYGEVSTGAADDLSKATDVARQSVVRFGMSPQVGQATLEQVASRWLEDPAMHIGHRDHSEATAREIDLAVRGMIDDAYAAAKTMLNESLDELSAGAELLLQRESITPSDFPPLLRPLANHPKADVSPALVADS